MPHTLTFRNIVNSSDSLAFGCSHTWGVGVEDNETWPFHLGAINFGRGSASADFIIRIAPELLDKHNPITVYVLWPDWTRFDYIKNGVYNTSLPTDKNRIEFMKNHTDDWLKNNFHQQVKLMQEYCAARNIKLVDMSLYDLIPYIDHANMWPLSKLGHHYAPSWHQQVADIFQNANINNIKHPIADD